MCHINAFEHISVLVSLISLYLSYFAQSTIASSDVTVLQLVLKLKGQWKTLNIVGVAVAVIDGNI